MKDKTKEKRTSIEMEQKRVLKIATKKHYKLWNTASSTSTNLCSTRCWLVPTIRFSYTNFCKNEKNKIDWNEAKCVNATKYISLHIHVHTRT